MLQKKQIDSTAKSIEIQLDANRNKYLKLNIILSIITLIVTIGTLITGLFGMNIENTLEESHHTFLEITYSIIFGILLIPFMIYYVLVKTGTLSYG